MSAVPYIYFLHPNGCFVNSEVWTGYSDSDLKDLEVIDHDIFSAITGAQAKVPAKMLYLETAQTQEQAHKADI